jgi:pimeloyl-ACP methyl ester carboxylesterase
MHRPCYADVAKSITCPTTVIAGAGDVPTPVSAHQEIADLIYGSTFHVLAKAGHLPPLETPDEVNGILWQWYMEQEFAVAAE